MRYGSVLRREALIRRGLFRTGLVQTHHVIPREFRWHPTIQRFDYDVNATQNLMLMPTPAGKLVMRGKIRTDRLTHGWGHKKYNDYVGWMLDCIDSEEDLLQFKIFLRHSLRHQPHVIPWQ